MVIITNAYRKLNHWNANCGASFEWVGRAIGPHLGFLTGWLILAANLVGNVAAVVVLAPSVLAIFGDNTAVPVLRDPARGRRPGLMPSRVPGP